MKSKKFVFGLTFEKIHEDVEKMNRKYRCTFVPLARGRFFHRILIAYHPITRYFLRLTRVNLFFPVTRSTKASSSALTIWNNNEIKSMVS